MTFSQYLEMKYLEWQQKQGGRKPEGEKLQRIAEKLGIEVYDVLGVQRPDPDLLFIQSHWEELTDSDRQKLRILADKYKGRNSSNEIARSRKDKK